MTGWRALMHRMAPLALLLALIATVGRIAAPAGFMPAGNAHGITFVLCSGATAPLAPRDGHLPLHDNGGDCPFAIAAMSGDAPLPGATILLPPSPVCTTAQRPFHRACPGAGIGARSQPATGPPIAI
jgi:hypothetical protein